MTKKRPHEMTDDDYKAQYDAQTLANAEVIKADAERLKTAQEWAAILVAEEKAEAEAMAKVAKGNA